MRVSCPGLTSLNDELIMSAFEPIPEPFDMVSLDEKGNCELKLL